MKIYVNNIEIETKDILQITDAGNNFHGFVINLMQDKKVIIQEPRSRDDSSEQKKDKNERYRALRKKVEQEWQKDKTEFIILNL